MTYSPKQFVPTALFLATKTDNHYTSLTKFASKLPNTTPESVKAPEFTLVQGLRFSFDVRHPHRGLEGGFMELQAMMHGRYVPRPNSPLSPQSIAESMLTIPSADLSNPWEPSTAGLGKRLKAAHQRASHLLKTSALLSDAYYLFTPAQIWLAAFLAADEPLARFYLDTILSGAAVKAPDSLNEPANDDRPSNPLNAMLPNLEACKQLLVSKAAGKPNEEELRELRKIDRKLMKCQNPTKADLSSLKGPQAEKKRDSEEGTGEEDGRSKKKRKVEDDDVFGPSISK
jgi:cyclin H